MLNQVLLGLLIGSLVLSAIYLFSRIRENIREHRRIKKTIVHECGHAIVGYVSPSIASVDKITYSDFQGFITITENPDKPAEQLMWEKLSFMLAGAAAEMLVMRRVDRHGCMSDLNRALQYAERMVLAGIGRPPWEGAAKFSGFSVLKLYGSGVHIEERAMPILEIAFARAYMLIKRYENSFGKLCIYLIRKGSMTAYEMHLALGHPDRLKD